MLCYLNNVLHIFVFIYCAFSGGSKQFKTFSVNTKDKIRSPKSISPPLKRCLLFKPPQKPWQTELSVPPEVLHRGAHLSSSGIPFHRARALREKAWDLVSVRQATLIRGIANKWLTKDTQGHMEGDVGPRL